MIDDTGGWNCGGYYARDIAAGGLGDTTFVPALAASSDGYFFRLAWWLGNARLRKYALAFGLDAKTGIDLPGENEGNWPTNAWEMRAFGVPMEPSEACFLGIGQGAMQATPLQIVNVASAVINGGTLYRPQIVREIRNPNGGLITRFAPASHSARSGHRIGARRGARGDGEGHRSGRNRLRFGDRRLAVFGKNRNGRNRRRQRPEHDVVRRMGADDSSAFRAGRLRRSQRRLRRDGRRADRARDSCEVLQQETVAPRSCEQLEARRDALGAAARMFRKEAFEGRGATGGG